MKNTHLEHLEDNILNGGSQGGKEAVAFLRSLGDMLDQGGADTRVTVKWDGAPAIICGVNPENGRFFVGTKSVFNKVSPKISYSEEDVDSMYSAGQLAEKLKADGMKPTPENIAKVRAAWDNYYHSEGAQTWLKDPRHNEKLVQKSIREAEKLQRGAALNLLAQTDGTEGAAAVPVNTQVNDNSSRQSVTNFTSHTSQVEDPRVNALAAGMSRF